MRDLGRRLSPVFTLSCATPDQSRMPLPLSFYFSFSRMGSSTSPNVSRSSFACSSAADYGMAAQVVKVEVSASLTSGFSLNIVLRSVTSVDNLLRYRVTVASTRCQERIAWRTSSEITPKSSLRVCSCSVASCGEIALRQIRRCAEAASKRRQCRVQPSPYQGAHLLCQELCWAVRA